MIRRIVAVVFIMMGAGFLSACAPIIVGSGPAHFPPAITDTHYRAADGTELVLQRWVPEGPVKAVVIGLHGYGDYANNFMELGEDLAPVGIAVYAPDQRGFGRSPTRGFWAGTETLVEDTRALIRLAHKRHPGVPVYLCGVSMGGAVALVTSASMDQQDLAGSILIAPAVWGRETLPWTYTALLWTVSHSLPALPVTGSGLDIMPTDNIDLLRRLWKDPHMTRSSRTDMVHGMVDLMDAALAAAPHVTGPVLLMDGIKDEIIPNEPIELLKERLPPQTAETRQELTYEDGFHMLLRGLNGPKVRQDIADWILTRSQ